MHGVLDVAERRTILIYTHVTWLHHFTQSWNKDCFTTCAAVQSQPFHETLAWQPQRTQDSPLRMAAINPYHPRLPMTPTTGPGRSKVRKTGNLHRAIYTYVSVQHEAPSQGLRQRKHGSIATRTFHGYRWLDGRNVVATLRLESHEGIGFYFGIQTEATSIYKTSSKMNHSTVSNVAIAWVLFNLMHFPCGIPIVSFLGEAVHKRPLFSRYNFARSQCTLWRNICMGAQLTTFFLNTNQKHCDKITKTCSKKKCKQTKQHVFRLKINWSSMVKPSWKRHPVATKTPRRKHQFKCMRVYHPKSHI